ncbi:MAG: ABC transporter permease [Hyphomicrobiaceae bacterium]|nr:MAG: ABC transporter permease [Hyphomicrobiaceae bacterium]
MFAYTIRRLGALAVTFLFMTMIVFASIRAIPGSTIDLMMESADITTAGSEVGARHGLERALGLDRPVHVQYLKWLGQIVTEGSLGRSLWSGAPVTESILSRLPVTMELGGLAIILSLIIGIPAGAYAAVRQDTLFDYAARWTAILVMAKPTFWLATMVVVLPSIWWGWSPDLVYVHLSEDPLRNLYQNLIPAGIMGLGLGAVTMRMTRAMMLEVLRQDFVRTARAKGLPERTIVTRHILRNALIPVVTLVGLELPLMFGGAVIMEQIFSIPGMGLLLLEAAGRRDYPIVVGVFLVVGAAVLITNLLVDLAYALLDPKIRYS